jgi:hypothetical protein
MEVLNEVYVEITRLTQQHPDLYKPLGIMAISVTVILIVSVTYFCCSKRRKKRNVRVFGKIKELTLHLGGGKKRNTWVDPFRQSNIDYQRHFEDELTNFLYCLGVDVCQLSLDDYTINFKDLDGNPCDETRRQYYPDYRWLLRHFSQNCREYALLLTKSRDQQLRHKTHHQKDLGWTIEEVLDEFTTVAAGKVSWELVISLACRMKDLCQSLRERLNNRSKTTYVQNEVENEGSVRGRESIINSMNEGVMLMELITSALTYVPKSLRDQQQSLLSLRKLFSEDYSLYVEMSRNNKRRFGRIADQKEKEEAIMGALEDIVIGGNNDILELMAVAILPRFNQSIN